MAANFTSKLKDWQARHEAALPQAVEAGLLVIEAAVKRAHTPPGYTSRKFATGRTRNSITHSRPAREGNAVVGRVGSNLKTVVWWTLGHNNRWTGRFEQVDLWTEPVMSSREAAGRKVQAVYAALMTRGTAP